MTPIRLIILMLTLFATSFVGTTVYAQLGDTQMASGIINAASAITAPPEPEIINDSLSLDSLNTSYNPTDPRAPAGVFTLTATWANTSSDSFSDVFVQIAELTGDNVVLNADGGPGGVGAVITIGVDGDGVLSPGETATQMFEIGLQVAEPFGFSVNVFGVP